MGRPPGRDSTPLRQPLARRRFLIPSNRWRVVSTWLPLTLRIAATVMKGSSLLHPVAAFTPGHMRAPSLYTPAGNGCTCARAQPGVLGTCAQREAQVQQVCVGILARHPPLELDATAPSRGQPGQRPARVAVLLSGLRGPCGAVPGVGLEREPPVSSDRAGTERSRPLAAHTDGNGLRPSSSPGIAAGGSSRGLLGC
jgi:hypothetical protein